MRAAHAIFKRRRVTPRRLAAACALFALLASSESRAQATPPAQAHARVVLDYAAPPALGCPDREAFSSAIATRLGYQAVVAGDAVGAEGVKKLEVVFARPSAATTVVVDLRLSSAAGTTEGTKRLASEAGACGDLGAAAAFAAAILVDPRIMFPRRPEPARPGESLESNAPSTWPWYEPRGVLPPPPPPPAAPVAPWRWRAGLTAGLCLGCAPSLSPGAGLLLGLARGRLGLDVGARADLPASATAASGREVSASLVAGEFFPHARFGGARLGVLGSAGTLFGDSNGDKRASLWAAVGARVAFEYRLAAPVFVRVAFDGLFTLSRVALRAEGAELWSSPIAVGGASLGVGVEL